MARLIVLLSYDYPPNDGGISRLSSAAAMGLAGRGCIIRVLTVASEGRRGLVRPPVTTSEVPRGKGWRDWATFRYLRRLPRGTAIVSTLWNPEGTLAWLAGHRDTVVMAHGNEVMIYPPGLRYVFKRWLRHRVLASARIIVCNSHYTENLVHAVCMQARTIVITPGVDASRFQSPVDVAVTKQHFGLPADKRILLSVSRMDAYKGHDVVLQALASLPAAVRARLHYTVAGKGSHVDVLRRLAVELGVGDCVTWLGFVDDEDLPSLYACADLFVLCTREDPDVRGVEGFGMVFLEAQAAGVPVLGTRAGGIPDAIVEEQGGWLVDQDDVEAVSVHLTRLVEDVRPFRVQGACGHARVCSAGSWEVFVSKLLTVINENP